MVLVLDGESIWRAENRYAGRSDIPLTRPLCQLIGVPVSAYRIVCSLIINGATTEISLHSDDASLRQLKVPLRFIEGGSPAHFCENEP